MLSNLIGTIDLNTVHFVEPEYLWLLVAPAALLLAWAWRIVKRQEDARLLKRRRLPINERFPLFGGLLFWLCVSLALSFVVLALARPQAIVSVVRTAGADVVVLQDGSASMQVEDMRGSSRWQRSMAFLRVLGESLRWKDDRLAMAAFAHIAAPQVRLTKDPNTFLFFLDHLEKQSPFPLLDDTTWDTNIELGLDWGLQLIDKDEEMHGRSPNARVFVLITDGQVWSGAASRALQTTTARNIPLFVVGVGTTVGGFIPAPKPPPSIPGLPPPAMQPYQPIHSSLDRPSLAKFAIAGGGQYFELDRDADRDIANKIIDVARRRAGSRGLQEAGEDLYDRCLVAAAAFIALGVLTLRERAELWIQLAGAGATLLVVWTLIS